MSTTYGPAAPTATESAQATVSDGRGREADPHYGIADRIALALFPFLDRSAADKEAGQ